MAAPLTPQAGARWLLALPLLPLLLLLASLSGCTTAEQEAGAAGGRLAHSLKRVKLSFEALPAARTPRPAGQFPPAMTRSAAGVTGAALAQDAVLCGQCHAAVVGEWRGSAHAAASLDNPLYRMSLEGFRASRGARASRFCGGCHDPALLIDGEMDKASLPYEDPRASVGVSCRVCHGASDASMDGNGSYTLAFGDFEAPLDEAAVARHRTAMMGEGLSGDRICVACHRSFVSMASGHIGHLAGMDDHLDWRQSGYAGSHLDRIDEVPRRGCRDCHMPLAAERGGRSHRFVGGHSWLAAARGQRQQLRETRSMLRRALALDLVAVDANGRPLEGEVSSAHAVDVLITNVGAGHRFPGGTRDAHASWVDVEQHHRGRVVARAEGGNSVRHILRAVLVNADGKPTAARAIEHFAAVAYDHTILPRDTQVVRFVLSAEVPVSSIVVRLWHRSRPLALQRRACAAKQKHDSFDPCVAQPRTLLAEAELTLSAAHYPVQVLLRHGRGWLHALGPDQVQARVSLERALRRAETASGRAAPLLERAKLAIAQGRGRDADGWLAELAAAAPGHPAASWWRAVHQQAIWRHAAAAEHLRALHGEGGTDARIARRLATSLAVLGAQRDALQLVASGLLQQPRNEALLRLQWQGYRTGGLAAAAPRAASHWAYLLHQARPNATWLAARCGERDAACAHERLPGHQHPLTPVPHITRQR